MREFKQYRKPRPDQTTMDLIADLKILALRQSRKGGGYSSLTEKAEALQLIDRVERWQVDRGIED